MHRLNLTTGAVTTLYRAPDSMIVNDAVASPGGGMLAMSGGACAPGVTSVTVRDLVTARQWSIGANLPHCTGLGPVSWNPTGTELMFAYAPVINPRDLPADGAFCTATRPARLAVVGAGHASPSGTWKLVLPDGGCSFEAGVFDHQGIAAVEGCQHGGRRPRARTPSATPTWCSSTRTVMLSRASRCSPAGSRVWSRPNRTGGSSSVKINQRTRAIQNATGYGSSTAITSGRSLITPPTTPPRSSLSPGESGG